ncbi:MAG: hypothetical protein AAF602_21210 [Myxococcota bacterium]
MGWIAWCFALAAALAHPNKGQTSVVVVMKQARCTVCALQLRNLARAELGAPVAGVTHDPPGEAAMVTRATGVRTYSHPQGIRWLGLWREDLGMPQPAVVVFDRCGKETGRIVGRQPGVDVTDEVKVLVEQAKTVTRCGTPVS